VEATVCTIIAIAVTTLLVIGAALLATRTFPGPTKLSNIKRTFWHRYLLKDFPKYDPDKDRQHADRLITYIERVIDRQINKARGILPFNSIIIAVFSLATGRLPANELVIWHVDMVVMLLFAIAGLAVSSVLCLILFLFYWWNSEDPKSFDVEFEDTLDIVRRRSTIIQWATMISLAALVLGTILVLAVEINRRTQTAVASPAASVVTLTLHSVIPGHARSA
jgi:hypothetical protein